MDILSHGLYGGVAFGRKSKKSYWTAFLFGVLPDLCSFGILFVLSLTALSAVAKPDFSHGPPDPLSVPLFVHQLYDFTHSFVTAGVVIGLVWLFQKKPLVELFAWPLHILVDIPTHSLAFFPTPFLWPLSEYRFNGVSWGTTYILLLNLSILLILYTRFYISWKEKQKTTTL